MDAVELHEFFSFAEVALRLNIDNPVKPSSPTGPGRRAGGICRICEVAYTLRRVAEECRIPEFAQGLPTTRAAVAYASMLHAGQRRRFDGAPFILHPLEVGSLLRCAGADDELIAAGVLHDVIEKTPASAADVRRRFGGPVATLVLAVTEDPRIEGYAKRKAALREQVASAGEEALVLFAADKLSKVRELRERLAAPPPRRLAHYRHCLRLLQERLPGSVLTRQFAAELDRVAENVRKPARTGAR
jgi:HD domain-containing protein